MLYEVRINGRLSEAALEEFPEYTASMEPAQISTCVSTDRAAAASATRAARARASSRDAFTISESRTRLTRRWQSSGSSVR